MGNNQPAVTNFSVVVDQTAPLFSTINQNALMPLNWEEEAQFALQTLQKSPRLAQCAASTVRDAIVNVASVGLTLNPADAYAYLVPEYNKDTKQNECQLRISFKGLIKKAIDSGVVEWVRAEIVRENDEFKFLGLDRRPEHNMTPFGERGDRVGVYCIAKLTSGDYMTDTMTWEQVELIKASAKTSMVWDKWPEEMAKKAIIKRAAKQWPKSPASREFHEAVRVTNDHEGNEDLMVQMERVADDIFRYMELEDYVQVGVIWNELSEREQTILWTAKTKGGWFSQEDKVLLRKCQAEYKKAMEDDDADDSSTTDDQRPAELDEE